MDYLLICAVALFASLLTFFTGFGLGTLLLPAFLVFFPPTVAVGLTAVVHLLNGLFKLVLIGRQADVRVALRFGLPALVASLVGAQVLVVLSAVPAFATYTLGAHRFEVSPVKVALAVLMLVFAVLELSKRAENLAIPARYLPLGGLLTGFFGGLSGHQGALRSAFLVRAGLTKESFVATGAVIAVAVDVARLTIYSGKLTSIDAGAHGGLLLAATGAAFAGAFLGTRLLTKTTMRGLQGGVAAALALIAVGLGAGWL